MIGQVISHYKILEKLGEGGMGVVYKAEDTKLDRIVALKFLPHNLTSNEGEQARFLQEAKAASALNHPNVCNIHSIGEHEGQSFIDMEFVEGATLRKMLAGGPLRLSDAIEYAIQISDALQEAHAKGIVHRDVKCENIMVNTRGQIKVMDFGLAKLKGSLKLTRSSSTVGTLAYMAPEQIQGGEIDHRSDIFSFGVVLFEMLTGKLPFRGEHDAAMMYSIVNEEPDPIQQFLPDASPELIHLVARALEKNPEDRYQSVHDISVDLRRLTRDTSRITRMSMHRATPQRPTAGKTFTVSGKNRWMWPAAGVVVLAIALILFWPQLFVPSESSGGRKMIVILPFENLGSADQEYFSDGITEEITSRLSGLPGLGVIARTSAMQYKKTTKTLPEIGSELGVEYVLQGTLRWGTTPEGATRVRVNPALIKISDGTQIWSQPSEAVVSDVFKLQSDIATEVASALGITLLQPERKSLTASHTDNSEAYDLYLRGNEYSRRSYEQQDFQIGLNMFEKAVELDPKFALAYARLSETHSAMYWFHYDHSKERLAKAKTAVDEALKLDPDLPDAHASLGYYYYWGQLDYDNALRELELAQRSRPNDSRLLLGVGSVQRRQGKFELAAASMSKALKVDPRSSEVALNTAQTYRLLRNYPEAERLSDISILSAPDWTATYINKALVYLLWTGDAQRARATIQKASMIAGYEDDPAILFMRVFIEMCDGNYQEALARGLAGSAKGFDDQFQFIPKAQLLAEANGLLRQPELQRAYYDSARVILERRIQDQPEDARFHTALGIAYAGLGRKEDAIREGKRGVELLPISKEAWRGTYRVRDLARIYVMVGEHSAALDQLEILLSRPSDISAPLLRIDPTWGPLRTNARFQRLIAERQ